MNNAWEKRYKNGDYPLWKEPHPEIGRLAELFEKNGVRRILDLGCGAGRHTVYLAKKGLDVYGLDSSPTGLAHAQQALDKEGLSAQLILHDMETLPFTDGYFDAVISVQVIHHNKIAGIQNTIKEITRILKGNGLIWITLPVSKNEPSKTQEEIEPGTFVPLDGPEKGLPHHYFRTEEIPLLFAGFFIIDLHIDTVNHFSLTAQKVG